MEIIPAIIPKSAEDLKEKLEVVSGLADTVHIDFVVDELFAKHFLQKSPLIFEAHLMLPHPEEYISDAVKTGFARALVQVESVSAETFAEMIHEWKGSVEISAVLEIETPLETIDSFAHELASVQLMGIARIGKQGEPFDPRVIPRVKTLHAKYPHLTIAVDGGVNKKNAEQLAAAGATRLVVGSAVGEFFQIADTPPFPSP